MECCQTAQIAACQPLPLFGQSESTPQQAFTYRAVKSAFGAARHPGKCDEGHQAASESATSRRGGSKEPVRATVPAVCVRATRHM